MTLQEKLQELLDAREALQLRLQACREALSSAEKTCSEHDTIFYKYVLEVGIRNNDRSFVVFHAPGRNSLVIEVSRKIPGHIDICKIGASNA